MIRFVLMMTAALLFATGCKDQSSNSGAKTSVEAADVLKFGFDTLDPGAEEAICANQSLFVYVGNAESMGTYKYADGLSQSQIDDHKSAIENSHKQYYKTIKDGLDDFQTALTVNRCGSYHNTKITLLGIVDGPGRGDSYISVTQYGFVKEKWKKAETMYFKVINGSLQAVSKEKSLFEINMPKRVPQIIAAFDKRYGPHTQMSYFLKTHGGLVKTGKQTLPSLIEATKVTTTKSASDQRHVLLFDANGEEGPIRSPLYTYMWMKENACSLLKGAGENDAYNQSRCDDVDDATEQGGDGGPTQGGDAGPTQGGDAGPTQGGDAGPTQGGDAGPTQGGDAGPTQGGDAGPTQGGDAGPTQGGDGGPTQGGDAGPTQGGDGGPTQGGDGGPTQGIGDGGLQGPGKALMYLSTDTPEPKLRSGNEPSATEPDILFMMGAVASYDLKANSKLQMYQLKLTFPEGTPDRPTLIVLDSCYGSDQVVKSADSGKTFDDVLDTDSKRKGKLKVCTMSNPKPTYSHTVNYGLLDTSSYLAMPFIFHWGSFGGMPDSTDQIDPLAYELGYVFMNPSSEDADAVRKKYEKDGIDPGEIKEEYLKLKPVCFERE